MSPVCACVCSVCLSTVCVYVCVRGPNMMCVSSLSSPLHRWYLAVWVVLWRSWRWRTWSLQAFGAAVKMDGCVPPSDSRSGRLSNCGTPRYGGSACEENKCSVFISPSHSSRTHRQVKVQSGCLLRVSRCSGQPKTISDTSRELLILLVPRYPPLFIPF